MGRKKKKLKISKKTKEVLIGIISLLIFYLLAEFGVLEKIDEIIENTGLAEIVKPTENSVIDTIPKVKTNTEIIENVSENIVIDKNKLNVLFFDVGQADCQLILYKGKSMLIDAGNDDDGEYIVNGLKGLGITNLDYVIGTHVHEDHIGGMSFIIDSFEIGEFYLPYNTISTTSYYKKLLTSLTNKEERINEVNVGDKIQIDDLGFEIMSVDNSEPENTNASSIVLEMNYGNQKYLFMADAEIENEEARTWNDVDVLKVGHHGSNTSSSEKFLNQVLPEISIISVGEGNSYELPKQKILNRLEKIGSTIYRTDDDGTIQIISDGNEIEVVKIDINFDSSQRVK
ncbi:MAG: MBL fold metallo-hydrolase [Clostridia bacterium]|nr:MBL fold metallo-hydrolase [Clostridia bacterium]